MARLNVLKTIEECKKKTIKGNYDIYPDDFILVKENSSNFYEFASNMFNLGFAQGIKAGRAEQKKLGV